MKLTSKILIAIGIILIAGILSSNIILKKQYDAIDKSDVYWTYDKILQQSFKHLNITGGNGSNIYYEQSTKPSVRVLKEWVRYHGGEVKAEIRNDTLFVNFDYKPANSFEKYWLENAAPLRIFSPELASVTGSNTHFEMQKLKQKSITINISGKSKFEVESMLVELDSINVVQRDSSAVVFEMSPDFKKEPSKTASEGKIEFHNAAGVAVEYHPQQQNDFSENMSINTVTANIKDQSILDVGHAQIKNLHVLVSDSSAIVLSGNALQKVNTNFLKK